MERNYELRFTQDVTYSVTVVVKATNNVEAIAKALSSESSEGAWEDVCNFAAYEIISDNGMVLQEVDGQDRIHWDGDCPVHVEWEIESDWHHWAEAYLREQK